MPFTATLDARSWGVFALGAALGAGLAAALIRRPLRGPAAWTAGIIPRASPICAAEGHGGDGHRLDGGFVDDEILSEQLTRNCQFFGEDAQRRVAASFVVVVGLGGVGSHAAHLLLRSGVGHLRLVDFDLVSLSTLNRHAVATREDVGTPKATCLKRHFEQILPEAKVEAQVVMYTDESEGSILAGNPDFVIDAIDNIDTKVSLLAACVSRGLKVLCVGGAGAKADPTRLRFTDISESSVDPLARAVRHRLKKDHGIERGVPVLLSTEKPQCDLVSLGAIESGNPLDYQIVPGFRVRTIPVLGTSPALFGMASASYVICSLAGRPFQGEPVFQMQMAQYDTQLARLEEREEARGVTQSEMQVDVNDVAVLVRDVWRGVSAAHLGRPGCGKDKGLNRNTSHLVLTRWDSKRPATADNLVLLEFDEADAHDQTDLRDLRQRDPDFVSHVEGVLALCRRMFGL